MEKHVIETGFNGEWRKVVIEIGKEYVVLPLNKAKKKNVGRHCILLELNDSFMPTEATVKWLDTNRKGKQKTLTDLVLVDS